MSPNDALRFLVTLGMETAEDLGRARKPAMQEALLSRIELAAGVLRPLVEEPARGHCQG